MFLLSTADDEVLQCCGKNGAYSYMLSHKACLPIALHRGDIRFRGSCMEFARSMPSHTMSKSIRGQFFSDFVNI